MFKKSVPLALLTLAPFACDSGDDFEGVAPTDLGAPTGKADGPELAIGSAGAFDVLQLRGDAAVDLFTVMDNAGGFERADRGSLTYRYGFYSICVSNGSAAACNVYSRQVELRDPSTGLQATVHGARFDSAASEMFGAMARASGVSPQFVTETSSRRFICGKTQSDVWCGLKTPEATGRTLELSFDGLPALGDDFVYEGWLITADGPVTSGRFEVSDGQDTHEFALDADLADASTMFVLTIEPRVGDVPAPSDTHIVAGVFDAGVAPLSLEHPAALGDNFLGSTGGFILETPSTAGIADDFNQGVWFLDPSAGPGAGLRLPALPAGWAYEGWVVGDEGPISTGTFTDPAGADRDGAGPTGGPDGSPPFPGQDFINPPMDLTAGFKVVVSVEPDPDDSPLPFAIKPLAGDVDDAGAGQFQTLGNIADGSQIGGLAVIR